MVFETSSDMSYRSADEGGDEYGLSFSPLLCEFEIGCEYNDIGSECKDDSSSWYEFDIFCDASESFMASKFCC